MNLPGMIDTGTIQAKSEHDYHGRVTSTMATTITGWRCRISEDFSIYARSLLGKGGRQNYKVIGNLTTTLINRGNILIISGVYYEVIHAEIKRTAGANHHWYLIAEKMPAGYETTCELGCETTCESSCETSCESSCEAGCETGCELSCETSCETNCESGCETNCETGYEPYP